MGKYSTINSSLLMKWNEMTRNLGLPEGALNISVRVIQDPTGKSDYTFGVNYNPYRFQRLNSTNTDSCNLCAEVIRGEEEKDNILSFTFINNVTSLRSSNNLLISTVLNLVVVVVYMEKWKKARGGGKKPC